MSKFPSMRSPARMLELLKALWAVNHAMDALSKAMGTHLRHPPTWDRGGRAVEVDPRAVHNHGE